MREFPYLLKALIYAMLGKMKNILVHPMAPINSEISTMSLIVKARHSVTACKRIAVQKKTSSDSYL